MLGNSTEARPGNGVERAVERHQEIGRDPPVEAEPDQERRPRRMADDQVRAEVEAVEEVAQGARHPRQGEPRGGERVGEAVARQVRGNDPEPRRQERHQPTPGMGGGPRAVEQQHGRGPVLPHFLDVPREAGGRDEAARLPVRPVGALALPAGSFGGRAHAGTLYSLADRIAALIAPASAWGRGR